MKALTYDERMQAIAPSTTVADGDANKMALVPLQDYEGEMMDYTDAAMGSVFAQHANGQRLPQHALSYEGKMPTKRVRQEKEEDEEPAQLSIAEELRLQQRKHQQMQLKTQVGAQSEFKAKIKEPSAMDYEGQFDH